MNSIIELFWKRLNSTFQAFAWKLLTDSSGFEQFISHYSNESFPLRAYLSFLKDKDGDELSLTVDIKNLKDGFLINSDISGDDGFVLVDGPSLKLTGEVIDNSHNKEIDKWFNDFDSMLVDKYDDVLAALRNL